MTKCEYFNCIFVNKTINIIQGNLVTIDIALLNIILPDTEQVL